jgi:hypothetical protein
VKGLASAIRQAVPGQLVAVGQDHPTAGRRPHPYFHADQVDYTSVHTWWYLDDICWDSAFVKVPGKPALVQETGVMHVEDNTERARRSERETGNMLERKLAYAFGAGTCGAIPWVLNSNVYMDDDNEVHIGMLRADLTEKPEFEAVRGIYGFIGRNAHLFENAMPADVCVIFPFANSYSNRAWANIATRKSARVLAYNLKQGFYGCGDFSLDLMGLPKLIIYPAPRVIPEGTWAKLMDKAAAGATVLVTGPLNFDEHWAGVDRTKQFGIDTAALQSVMREETVILGDEQLRAVFDSQLISWVDKEVMSGKKESELYTFPVGNGAVLWCPLPIEMNRDDAVVESIYSLALAQARIEREIEFISGDEPGVFIRKLKFKKGSIYILVSEDGSDRVIEFIDRSNDTMVRLSLPSGKAVMAALDGNGKITDCYNADFC